MRKELEDSRGEIFKIAIGFDPEDEPSPLFDYAFQLARLLDGLVIIVHAIEVPLEKEKTLQEEKKIVEEINQLLKERFFSLEEGKDYLIRIIYGKDIKSFNHFIEKEEINLFGFYYYKKLFGKNFSQVLLENLNSPLLVLKEKVPYREIERILIPIDFSETSFRQREFIERLMQSTIKNFKITFLHILNEEKKNDPAEKEEVKLLFNEFFGDLGELTLDYGEPEEKIVKYLKDYDLVVIGKTGKGLNSAFGKVSMTVIENAEAPIIVL